MEFENKIKHLIRISAIMLTLVLIVPVIIGLIFSLIMPMAILSVALVALVIIIAERKRRKL
ncbi:MAG: hypothetical protein ACD_76C00108G0002 [uncultured bacterium]|nr:MAG: hypothetical protein ACD_76C00108G0002 [uncultured bacterium]HBD05552.1 hypothetical protein [Candidatus Uhrbacteria bacterium]